MKTALRVAILGLLAVSCRGGTGPSDQLVGIYELVSIDGRTLPTTLDGTSCGPRYNDARLAFGDGNRSRVVFTRAWKANGCDGGGFPLEHIDGHYAIGPSGTGGHPFAIAFPSPYDGLTTNAGAGSVDASRATITVHLREAGMVSPPAAVFVFRLR